MTNNLIVEWRRTLDMPNEFRVIYNKKVLLNYAVAICFCLLGYNLIILIHLFSIDFESEAGRTDLMLSIGAIFVAQPVVVFLFYLTYDKKKVNLGKRGIVQGHSRWVRTETGWNEIEALKMDGAGLIISGAGIHIHIIEKFYTNYLDMYTYILDMVDQDIVSVSPDVIRRIGDRKNSVG